MVNSKKKRILAYLISILILLGSLAFSFEESLAQNVTTTIAGGGYHSVINDPDGSGWAWGLNSYGQLGDNSINPASSPVQVVSGTGRRLFI